MSDQGIRFDRPLQHFAPGLEFRRGVLLTALADGSSAQVQWTLFKATAFGTSSSAGGTSSSSGGDGNPAGYWMAPGSTDTVFPGLPIGAGNEIGAGSVVWAISAWGYWFVVLAQC